MDDPLEHFRDVMSFPKHGRMSERGVSASGLENNSAQLSALGFKTPLYAQYSADNIAKGNTNNHHSNNNDSNNNNDDRDSITEDDQTELIQLLNEVTHTVCQRDEAETKRQPSGGFLVEESYGSLQSVTHTPLLYSSPAPSQTQLHGESPFNYSGIPHISKPPPPSFAEAIAATPPITAMPVELSPLAAHYVPPMPAAQQDPILLLNEHGVFLLQPIAKPTPPYTPPSVSSPISPLPRYALPPAAPPQQQQHFLGSSLAQTGGHADAHLNKKSSGGMYVAQHSPNALLSGSHLLGGGSSSSNSGGGAGAYTYISTSVKAKPVGFTPPPPYPT